jgi:hypothetical protein
MNQEGFSNKIFTQPFNNNFAVTDRLTGVRDPPNACFPDQKKAKLEENTHGLFQPSFNECIYILFIQKI